MTKFDVVRLVLKKLVELYEVDTSVLWPDDLLSESGINQEMARNIYVQCLRDAGVDISTAELVQVEPGLTCRELVDSVFSRFETAKMKVRAAS
jgi:hypothetical protein